MSPARISLPSRRSHDISRLIYPDRRLSPDEAPPANTIWDVGMHRGEDGEVREIFLDGNYRVGSEREGDVHDICVLLSMLLQCGYTVSEIATKLGGTADEPASIAGAVVRHVVGLR